jgi:hypothetical protein
MSTLGTANLIQRVEDLTAKLDDCAAEKHALELALAASTAYGREQYAQARQAEENYTEAVSRSCASVMSVTPPRPRSGRASPRFTPSTPAF